MESIGVLHEGRHSPPPPPQPPNPPVAGLAYIVRQANRRRGCKVFIAPFVFRNFLFLSITSDVHTDATAVYVNAPATNSVAFFGFKCL